MNLSKILDDLKVPAKYTGTEDKIYKKEDCKSFKAPKLSFPTKEEAEAAMRYINEVLVPQRGWAPVKAVYKCKCGKFHVSTILATEHRNKKESLEHKRKIRFDNDWLSWWSKTKQNEDSAVNTNEANTIVNYDEHGNEVSREAINK